MKIGIIGSEEYLKLHIDIIKTISSVNLIGYYNNSDQINTNIPNSENYNIQKFSSPQELILNSDILYLVCSKDIQFTCAQDAIKAGKNIFIGNSLNITDEESNKLIKLTKEAQVVSYISNKNRFDPNYISIQEKITKPLFINIEHSKLFDKSTKSTSVISDLMLEDLDIIFKTIKSPIKSINANGATFSNNTIDIANVRIEFLNGSTANLSANKLSNKKIHQIEFVQKDQFINVDYLNHTSQILETNKAFHDNEEPINYTENRITITKEREIIEFEYFIDLINNRVKNTDSLEEASLTLRVSKQIIQIIKNKL